MWRAKGTNGTVVFDGRTVTIERTGAVARSIYGGQSKAIPVDSIGGIAWKPAGLTAGQISFNITGATEARVMHMGRGAKQAMKDPNTVAFHVNRQRDFEAVRDAIQAAIAGAAPQPVAAPQAAAARQPVPTTPPPPPPHATPAGWYPDPSGQAPHRWWDGTAWTEHTG